MLRPVTTSLFESICETCHATFEAALEEADSDRTPFSEYLEWDIRGAAPTAREAADAWVRCELNQLVISGPPSQPARTPRQLQGLAALARKLDESGRTPAVSVSDP